MSVAANMLSIVLNNANNTIKDTINIDAPTMQNLIRRNSS
jgi:hypothetical protein